MAKPYERRTRFYPDPRRPYERMVSLETPLKRDQLEAYEDNLLWEMIRGAAVIHAINGGVLANICFPTSYLNKTVEAWVTERGWVVARSQDANNFYWCRMISTATTADFDIRKTIAGTITVIASEAIDVNPSTIWKIKLEIENSTMKGYREDMTTPKITTSDTAITTEGKWGTGQSGDPTLEHIKMITFYSCVLGEPASPTPKVLRYYEVPIVGKGSFDNPFKPQLPEEITDHPTFGKVNRLAFSWGGIISTDRKTGKPIEYIGLIQVFEQPVRQKHLRSIHTCLSALEAVSGVKRLRKDIFERRKKKLLES